MFARSIHWRRGIKNAECNPADPGGRVSKRSTMQDLVEGKCPDVKAAVEELQNYDKVVTDESREKPDTGDDGGDNDSDGSDGDGDEDDIAANVRMLSSLGMGIVGTTALFLLL